MYRVLPARWLSSLSMVVIFGVIAALTSARIARQFVIADLATWFLVGGALGVAVSVLIALIWLSHDTRLLTVREMLPNALVVQAVRDDTYTDWLPYISELSASQLSLKRLFTVAFDRPGISFWTGSRDPLKVAEIPWKNVDELKLGDTRQPKFATGYQTYHLLRLTVRGNDEPLTIQFGLEPSPGILRSRSFMSEAEVVGVAAQANEIWHGGVQPHQAASSHLSAGLVAGRTAWAAQRFPVGPPVAKLVLLQLLFVAAIATLLLKLPIWSTWLVVGISAAVYVTLALSARLTRHAAQREKAAGYTTLNGVDLALEQRHPVTGVVIRAANALPLTRQQFAALVRA